MKRMRLLAPVVLVMAIAAIPTASRADAVGRVDAVAPADWTIYVGSSPSPRVGASTAYDSVRARTVLFGGYTNSGTPLGDTWEWDGASWTQTQPARAPSPRGASGMTFDGDRNRTVLFGGSSGAGSLGDTWEYDGTTWSQIATPVSPSARPLPGMAYHAASRRVLLFGGGGSVPFADTWEWDGATWLQRQPLTSPSGRTWFPLAYDSGRQRTVLFGGYGRESRLADTWEWDGNTWSQRQPATSPSPRFGHTLVYDSRRGVTVLFGGDSYPPLEYSDETWEWDGHGWTLHWTTDWPPERVWAAAAFDAARGQTVLFGGTTGGQLVTVGDTWLYAALPGGSPGAALMPHRLTFPLTAVGDSSSPLVATVLNSGNAPTTISSITGSGAFYVAASDCPTAPGTLAVGASCKVEVIFEPADRGSHRGQLTLTDDAGTGTQNVELSGWAEYPFASVAPPSLNFGDQAAGTVSDPRTVSITATWVPLTIFGFETGGAGVFEVTNVDCPLAPETLAPSTTCRVEVTFAPQRAGAYWFDTVTITHSGSNNPSRVTITGSGV